MSELSWWAHLWSVLPEIVLVVAAVVIMAVDAWLPEGTQARAGLLGHRRAGREHGGYDGPGGAADRRDSGSL
jgi:hypothetical protein